jgi:hypothetical protein
MKICVSVKFHKAKVMHTSSVPLFWRLKGSKYRMVGTKCAKCGSAYFPPRYLCPRCRRHGKIEPFQFSGRGEIVTYTIIRTPPSGFERQSPYAVGIIKLDEGSNVTGQIAGNVDGIGIGRRVRSVFRRVSEDGSDGIINYGFKFELDDGAAKK